MNLQAPDRHQAFPTTSAQDIAACASLMSTSEPWTIFGYDFDSCLNKLRSVESKILTVQIDGAVAGFIEFHPKGLGSSSLIGTLCVGEAHRGHGIGTALLSAAEDIIFEYDQNIFLCVSDFNEDAIVFYQKRGFIQVGAIPNYNLEGKSELIFRKTTGPRLTQSKDR